MKPKRIERNKKFIERFYELQQFYNISQGKEASIIVTYGRRHVGKTELPYQWNVSPILWKIHSTSS